MGHKRRVLALTTVLSAATTVFSSQRAAGADTSWTNAALDNLWSNPANWSAGVPDASTSALILSGGSIDLGGATVQAAGVTITLGNTTFSNGVLVTSLIHTERLINAVDTTITTSGPRLTFQTENSSLRIRGPIVGGGFDVELGATLMSPSSYTGKTILSTYDGAIAGPGSVLQTSAVQIGTGLVLDNSASNSSNRLNDGAPIQMFGGALVMYGNGTLNSFERVGTIEMMAHGGGLFLNPVGTVVAPITLSAAGVRSKPGMALDVEFDPRKGHRILFDRPPEMVGDNSGPTHKPVVAFLYSYPFGSAPALSSSLLTYDTGTLPNDPSDDLGLRQLDPAIDFETSIPTSGSPANVLLRGAHVLPAATTVNSLLLDDSSNLEIQSGALTIASGALHLGGSSSIVTNGGGSVDLGNHGVISGGELSRLPSTTIDVPIHANDLAIAGFVYLNRANDIAGPVSVWGGVRVGAQGALGSGTLNLSYSTISFAAPMTLSNPIVFNPGSEQFPQEPVAGPQDLFIGVGSQTITLNGPLSGNGYIQVRVLGGLLRINSDGDFGAVEFECFSAGQAMELNGTLRSSISPQMLGLQGDLGGEGSFLGVVKSGSISPGRTNQPGQFTVDSVWTNLTYFFDLGGTGAGESYDQLVLLSSVIPRSTQPLGRLMLDLSFVPNIGEEFLIFDDRFTGAVPRAFQSLPEGATIAANGVSLRISYLGGDGNDITLTVVPEPAMLLMIPWASMLMRRRRT